MCIYNIHIHTLSVICLVIEKESTLTNQISAALFVGVYLTLKVFQEKKNVSLIYNVLHSVHPGLGLMYSHSCELFCYS